MAIFTVKDLELYANANSIPLLAHIDNELCQVHIAYFRRDEEKIKEDFYYMVPAGIFINHYVVDDKVIEYSQQKLVDLNLFLKEK